MPMTYRRLTLINLKIYNYNTTFQTILCFIGFPQFYSTLYLFITSYKYNITVSLFKMQLFYIYNFKIKNNYP